MTSPTTTTRAPKPEEVARSIFEALAKRDLDVAMEFINEDTVDDFVAIGLIEGRTAIRRFFDELIAAFPDFEMSTERIVGSTKAAVVQWRATGTFSGDSYQGIQSTGKHVEIRGVDVMEIKEGRVTHNTIYYDGASFARQIGLLPREGSAVDKAMLSTFNTATRVRKRIRV